MFLLSASLSSGLGDLCPGEKPCALRKLKACCANCRASISGVFIFLRLKRGLSPFHPDRNHLHFQLLRRNLSEKKVTIIIYLLVMISISIGLFNFDLKLAQIIFLSSLSLFVLMIQRFIFSKN